MSDDRKLLEAVNVRKEFGGRGRGRGVIRAVDDVSFSLASGETLAIVGESGSGKSTLARLLLRLIEPTGGAVFHAGRNLFALSSADMRAARRHIQMVFQDPYASLHPRKRVADIIAEPWEVHRGIVPRSEYPERIAELMNRVGLPLRYLSLHPSSLSGGERQRVAIARALCLRPDVLVLDEPVSALDVSVQAQVVRLLMEIQEQLGLTYIFISHDLALVRLVATNVAVMFKGKFVEIGAAEEIYARPQHQYTRELLDSSPSFHASKK